MSAIGRAWRRRAWRNSKRLIEDGFRKGGIDPRPMIPAAIQAECGFGPFKREKREDYLARAAGVSRESLERYNALMEAGGKPLPEMAHLHAFMERVGKRIVISLHQALTQQQN